MNIELGEGLEDIKWSGGPLCSFTIVYLKKGLWQYLVYEYAGFM